VWLPRVQQLKLASEEYLPVRTNTPCIVLDGLTEAQKRAYLVADNKLALNAGWNEELLRAELLDLKGMDFDLGLLGFDPEEIAEGKKAGSLGLIDALRISEIDR
jgi:hypothetical protein